MANKVKFGLKKAYYAVLTVGSGGTISYGTPVAMPGAVSLSLSPQGDETTFYADDVAYWRSVANQGYSGDLELALVPDSFKTSCLGYVTDSTTGITYEPADAEPARFAFLFEVDGDDKKTRFAFYDCTASRPAVNGNTVEASKTPNTETLTITAIPGTDGVVKGSCPEGGTKYSDWYTAVQQPVVS